jgi:osmotically inducible protein OsmC
VATERKAEVEWIGGLIDGEGKIISTTSGLIPELDVTWAARNDETEPKTSPEELLAAAHASCYSMELAHGLVGAGWDPEVITVSAAVSFEIGIGVTEIKLTAQVESEGIPDELVRQVAERAKATCPISKALAGVEISLDLPDLPPLEEEELEDEELASLDAADET